MAAATITKKSGKAKLRSSQLPTKRSINLAGVGEKPIDLRIAIPATILIVVAAALLSKFAVVDRLVAVAEAEHEVAVLQREVDDGYAKIRSFGELTDRYAHYTYSDMTREEVERVDRLKAIEMMRRVVLPKATVDSWAIVENTLTMTITSSTLQEINGIREELNDEPIVTFVNISTAATGNLSYRDYYDENDIVTAQLTVYLLNQAEEAGV